MKRRPSRKTAFALPIAILLSLGLALPTTTAALAEEPLPQDAVVTLDEDNINDGVQAENNEADTPGEPIASPAEDKAGADEGVKVAPGADGHDAGEPAEVQPNDGAKEDAAEGEPEGPIQFTFVRKDATKESVEFADASAELGFNGTPKESGFWIFKSYFIGWSDNSEYATELTGHLFYDFNHVQDVLDAGVEPGAKLYAMYANTALPVAKGTSVGINDAVTASEFVSSTSGQETANKQGDSTVATYKKAYGDYQVARLDSVFKMNPFVAAAIYKDPWVGALENGSDWKALSKKKGRVTVVDLHVKIDERLVLPETFDLTFHSYVFRPYKVFSALNPDGTAVADDAVYPYIAVDQEGDKPGYGVLNRIQDNNPDTTFTVKPYLTNDAGGQVPVHDFVIRARVRTGYDAWGKKIIPATMEQIQSDMTLTMQGSNFTVKNEDAAKIAAGETQPIEISGTVDGLVKGVYFGPVVSEKETLDFQEVIDIQGAKTWDDEGQENKRPEEITIRLKDGEREVASKTVTKAEGWKWKFKNLPKYRDVIEPMADEGDVNADQVAPDGGDGNPQDAEEVATREEITYTIVEDPVEGYASTINGFNVTNTLEEVTPPEPPVDPEETTKPSETAQPSESTVVPAESETTVTEASQSSTDVSSKPTTAKAGNKTLAKTGVSGLMALTSGGLALLLGGVVLVRRRSNA